MQDNATIEKLQDDWEQAKKAADSLGIDFRQIEKAREQEAAAKHRYHRALELQTPPNRASGA